MKKLLLLFLLLSLSFLASGASFVNPNTFKGSEKERQEVVAWIKENIKKKYSAIGMDNPSTLRMMEKEDLNSFKELIVVGDKKLLTKVIDTYSAIGINDYNTILMMYREEEKSSKESLSW